MIIYIDSNLLYSDPYLSSSRSRAILNKVNATGGKLKIPLVVHAETLNNLLKEVSEIKGSFSKNVKEISKMLTGSGLLESMVIPSFEEEDIRTSYQQRYQDLIESGYVELIDHKAMNPEELIDDLLYRALNHIKPFAAKKEEFKDAVIWKTVISDIINNKYSDCIFLTNNTKDFYNDDNSILHDDLLKDIPDSVSLITYKSMNDLLSSDEFTLEQGVRDGSVVTSSFATSRELMKKLGEVIGNINKDYLLDKLRNEYLEDVQSDLMLIFDHLSNEPEGFESYFPLIAKDLTRYLKMRVESNYFMDHVALDITDLNNYEIIFDPNSREDIVIVCDLIVVPKLKLLKDVYAERELETAKLNIKMSFAIDIDEKLSEFNISFCLPVIYKEPPLD
ncbi:PIN domain-containing protein [Exiguobacterium sp. RIT594]|uniref:PIN domain-containing protein n=1 Tax=Exiguobacterium sp. RIT594 TaxID=2282449 RepID=UPI000DF7BA5A|nr:PIN domain-containing protein [Exiguobacterium sp. RIT594]RDB32063.1 DUF4935 domain-containing protein [Exiguobacterium sp. RIT594]